MEHKTFAAYTVAIDEPEGIVEKIVAVMGNVDQGDDRIWNGAFSKTIQERGLKIKGLDQHDSHSVRNVIAKTLAMREMGRDELPPELVASYPDATGALWVKAKYMLGTQAGREVFTLIHEGAVDESSIGYDPIIADYSTIETPDGEKTVRNLREIKLYEWSDVVWAMNPGTTNLSAKDTEPDADDKTDSPFLMLKEDDLQRIMERFDQFEEMVEARFASVLETDDHDAPPEAEAADDTPTDDDAGPDIPPTAERLAAVEVLRQEFEQLEV